MFWNIVRWGGTVVIVLVAVMALIMSETGGSENTQGVQDKASLNSKFNLQ